MNLLKGDSKYADVMELALYNGVLSGISISGDHFFYRNPLESKGGARRSSWIGLSCCPTNLTRIIPEVGGLAYAVDGSKQKAVGRSVYVNLYMNGEASLTIDGESVKLSQRTQYPWDGHVRLTVGSDRAIDFTVCLRIPGWAMRRPVPSDLYRFCESKMPPSASKGILLKVNGQPTDATPASDGYVHLTRRWRAGDNVDLDLPMPIERVYAHEKVREDQGKVALMRGPIVYCVEAADNPGVDLFHVSLPHAALLKAEYRADLLGGVTVIHGLGSIATSESQALANDNKPVSLTAVPYYAWANREPGAMAIWVKD
jgi:DUF1680 family protein